MDNPSKTIPQCPKCGHPNHKCKIYLDICTFYVPALGAECGCDYPQSDIRESYKNANAGQ